MRSLCLCLRLRVAVPLLVLVVVVAAALPLPLLVAGVLLLVVGLLLLVSILCGVAAVAAAVAVLAVVVAAVAAPLAAVVAPPWWWRPPPRRWRLPPPRHSCHGCVHLHLCSSRQQPLLLQHCLLHCFVVLVHQASAVEHLLLLLLLLFLAEVLLQWSVLTRWSNWTNFCVRGRLHRFVMMVHQALAVEHLALLLLLLYWTAIFPARHHALLLLVAVLVAFRLVMCLFVVTRAVSQWHLLVIWRTNRTWQSWPA